MSDASVPDAETLRQRALQSSWRRDRSIARRRVWLRWLNWIVLRYVLPGLLAMGLAAWVWLKMAPSASARSTTSMPERAAATTPAAQTGPMPEQPAAVAAESTAGVVGSGEGSDQSSPEPALRLRLEGFRVTSGASVSPTVSLSADSQTPLPRLKTENWLHSKEP